MYPDRSQSAQEDGILVAAGQTLLHYRLVEKIGEGGMGVVWKALDTKLEREVAIKILPESFAGDPDRLARFEREAKAVAALAHPGIVAIHDFGREGETVYAATELLDGQTLRERLEGGPLPPRKAVELARQIARALGAAHEKGFVHRDLKPENLFVTREGRAKILDFGLAAPAAAPAGDPAATQSPTRTSLTAPGVVLGTVDYMSPEQVRGEPVDRRSDIFSLGAVLYELLTGRRPFHRDTPAETMTAILREDLPERPGSEAPIPPALDRVVRRCLEKSPDERFHSARDLAFAVENAIGTSSAVSGAVEAAAVAGPATSARRWLAATALVVLGILAGAWLGGILRSPARPEPVRVRTLTFSGSDSSPSASPDGKMIAFASERDGRSRIWIKQLAGGGEQPLTEGQDILPRFSPDGSAVLFLRAEGDMLSAYRQALVGDQPRKLVENVSEATWSPDGRQIAFVREHFEGGQRTNVIGVADSGEGAAREIARSQQHLYGLSWSPDGRRIAAIETPFNMIGGVFFAVDPASGEVERVALERTRTAVSGMVWNRGGDEVIFARAGSVTGDQGDTLSHVVRYDLGTGAEQTLFFAEHLFPNIGIYTAGVHLDIAGTETLVLDAGRVRENLRQFPLDARAGVSTPRPLTRGHGLDRQPVYSHDAERVLFSSNRSGNLDLWLLDLKSGALRQLTDDAAQDWDPAFTPDGEHLLWSSDRGGNLEIWISNADGSGARQVTRDGRDAENPTATPDGEWIVYWSGNPETLGVCKIRPDGSEVKRLVAGSYVGTEVSPDGRWAAYLGIERDNLRHVLRVVDIESGEIAPFEIVVPAPHSRPGDILVGRNRWLADGSAIAYVGLDEQGRTGIFVQDFVPGQDTAATRRPLAGFSREFLTESFDISPDGSRITIAGLEVSYHLMLAEGVPGVARPEPAGP